MLEARALQVGEEICRLPWGSISELHRSEVLGQKEILRPASGNRYFRAGRFRLPPS
jgi:hypothetical protein